MYTDVNNLHNFFLIFAYLETPLYNRIQIAICLKGPLRKI